MSVSMRVNQQGTALRSRSQNQREDSARSLTGVGRVASCQESHANSKKAFSAAPPFAKELADAAGLIKTSINAVVTACCYACSWKGKSKQ